MLAITSSIKNNTIIITIENQDQKMIKIKKMMMTIASYKNDDEDNHKIIKIKRVMVTIVS